MGPIHEIPLFDILYVDVGKTTAALKRLEETVIPEDFCLSLLTKGGSLDLVAGDLEERDSLVSCFCWILDGLRLDAGVGGGEGEGSDWRDLVSVSGSVSVISGGEEEVEERPSNNCQNGRDYDHWYHEDYRSSGRQQDPQIGSTSNTTTPTTTNTKQQQNLISDDGVSSNCVSEYKLDSFVDYRYEQQDRKIFSSTTSNVDDDDDDENNLGSDVSYDTEYIGSSCDSSAFTDVEQSSAVVCPEANSVSSMSRCPPTSLGSHMDL